MDVRVGTSGYSFKYWVGPFYPPGTTAAGMLDYYVRHFPAVEVNTTYYRVPAPAMMARMEERTPAGFEFFVKLHGDMTHKASRDPALFEEFTRALEPLDRAGKLRGLLAQFPHSFRNRQSNGEYIGFLRDVFDPWPLFVEFRHDSWLREPVFDYLRHRGIGYASVDEPPLRGLLPPVATATTPTAYVRFHGRNAATWWTGDASTRYDYDYSEAELREWLAKIRALADRAERVYIFFNNCHAGHAAKNAQLMQRLVDEDVAG